MERAARLGTRVRRCYPTLGIPRWAPPNPHGKQQPSKRMLPRRWRVFPLTLMCIASPTSSGGWAAEDPPRRPSGRGERSRHGCHARSGARSTWSSLVWARRRPRTCHHTRDRDRDHAPFRGPCPHPIRTAFTPDSHPSLPPLPQLQTGRPEGKSPPKPRCKPRSRSYCAKHSRAPARPTR